MGRRFVTVVGITFVLRLVKAAQADIKVIKMEHELFHMDKSAHGSPINIIKESKLFVLLQMNNDVM